MSLSIEQPQSYPAALLTKRRTLPSHLHIFVERPSVHDIYSSQQFNYDAVNKPSIEAHFQRNLRSSFISLYESEDTASRKRPHTEKVRGKSQSYDAVKVEIDTSGMTPAWISVENGVHIPVWFEQDSRESEEAHNGEVLWFCLEEVKVVLSMDDNLGEKGEWLACGFIPQRRMVIHSKLSNPEPPQRVFNDAEKHEADRQARRERLRIENERLQLDQQEFEHRIKKAQSSRSIKAPPQIPTRKSSLNSLAFKTVSEPKKEVSKGSKLSVTTRGTEVSWTNADPQRAASLMKYAVLMAHGKRLDAEGTWLSDTTLSAGDLGRAGSTRTIGSGPPKERRYGFAGPITPPESPKSSSRRQETHEQRGRENGEGPTLRYKLAQHDDDQSSQEERRRVRRSAAPSPSQSMLGFHLEGSNEHSLRPRRSRRDLLLELQSDQDSVLREYARVSLQDPSILRASRLARHGNTNEDAESQIYDHEDSQSLISLRNRFATSTSSPPSFVPAHNPPSNRDTHDEAREPPLVNPRAPSLYSTMSSLASLSTFEHASIGKVMYVSVEPASHIKEVDIVRSKKTSSGSGSSGWESSVQSMNEPRLLEVQGEAEAVVVPFPAFNLQVQPEQREREAPPPPQPKPTPKVVSVLPTPTSAPTLPPAPAPTPSKSESFLAKAKCLGEKGREITSRIAEIRERQKPKAKKEKWELGMWRSGDKKEKNENRRIGEQDD